MQLKNDFLLYKYLRYFTILSFWYLERVIHLHFYREQTVTNFDIK